MHGAIEYGRRCARSILPVLLVGERSVGKDWLARQIHHGGSRSGAALVKVHCSTADPGPLLAQIQAASGGTLLLEDIDRASMAFQCQLLASIEQELNCTHRSDTGRLSLPRLMATTTCDPGTLLHGPMLRQELFYLLSPATITIPPLRRRMEDLPAFIDLFLRDVAHAFPEENRLMLAPESLQEIMAYTWPGNLGQLQCAIQRAALWSNGTSVVLDLDTERAMWDARPQDMEKQALHAGNSDNADARSQPTAQASSSNSTDFEDLTRLLVRQGITAAEKARKYLYPFVVNSVEKELIAQVLDDCENVQTKAAGRLGINRNTLHKKVRDYELPGDK